MVEDLLGMGAVARRALSKRKKNAVTQRGFMAQTVTGAPTLAASYRGGEMRREVEAGVDEAGRGCLAKIPLTRPA